MRGRQHTPACLSDVEELIFILNNTAASPLPFPCPPSGHAGTMIHDKYIMSGSQYNIMLIYSPSSGAKMVSGHSLAPRSFVDRGHSSQTAGNQAVSRASLISRVIVALCLIARSGSGASTLVRSLSISSKQCVKCKQA